MLLVSDHGPGVAEKDVGRIFERFERASPMRHYGGLGLGLYVSREIVRGEHGTIGVRNLARRGSLFRSAPSDRTGRRAGGRGGRAADLTVVGGQTWSPQHLHQASPSGTAPRN